ncbi:hypothetical protein OsJ_26900 [Oryza sativa Japonica Group]|uniref:Uncharacterized protein n=1 Tax=Oryza sativa subsp. japonica TaxID=39947 RepID=A3BRY7_ORYSJ|nr:hypothetical protein OsJ_26900 [Oryza sativa Japonica Group]
MQAGKNAMQSTKEAAANGQVEKATARNAADKDAAEVRRQERLQAAEEEKQHAMAANAAAKERATGGAGAYHPVGRAPPGWNPRAAQPTGGHVQDGVAESRPVGTATGTARPSAAHNPHVGSDFSQAHGTGGQYQ